MEVILDPLKWTILTIALGSKRRRKETAEPYRAELRTKALTRGRGYEDSAQGDHSWLRMLSLVGLGSKRQTVGWHRPKRANSS